MLPWLATLVISLLLVQSTLAQDYAEYARGAGAGRRRNNNMR